MAYTPQTWTDRAVEKPRTYQLQDNGDGTYTLIPAPGTVYEEGTKVTAARLNHIEAGIADALPKTGGGTVKGSVTLEDGFFTVRPAGDPSKIVLLGYGSTDVYVANLKSGKYLQLKDNGDLYYSNATIWRSDNDRGFMGAMLPLPSFTDYNDLTTPGVYHGVTGVKDNEPITTSGNRRVRVVVESQGLSVYQKIYYLDGVGAGQAFWRYVNTSTWRGFGGLKSIQKGTVSLSGNATQDVTISAVNTSKAYPIVAARGYGFDGSYTSAAASVTAEIISSTTLRIVSSVPGSAPLTAVYHVIESY